MGSTGWMSWMQMRPIQFWLQLLGYLLGAQIRVLLLAWATRTWGVKPPRLYFLYKDHRAQSWMRVKNISLHGEFRLQNLAETHYRMGTPFLISRSACKNLNLFEMEGTYISSLAFQYSSPSPPLLLSYPSSPLCHHPMRFRSFSVSFLYWFIIWFQAGGYFSQSWLLCTVSAMKQLHMTGGWTRLMCSLVMLLSQLLCCNFAAGCPDWWLQLQLFELFSVTRQPNKLRSLITHKLRTQISGDVSVIIL